jgi:uncharacterized protein involved in outer membrane biogenesis
MKTLFRWAFRLFILLIVLIVAAILLLDTAARAFVEYQLGKDTGLEVKVGHVNVGLLHPIVTIENLVIYNKAEFGGSPFIELPELHVEYDLDALRSRRLHCKLLRFNLAELNLVEDKQGRRNFESLLARANAPAPGAQPKSHPPMGPASWQKLGFSGIDTLNLSLGKATYLHMKQPDKVDELKINVNHQVFTNIKTEQDFSGALLMAFLKSGANLMQSNGAQTWLQLLSPPVK